MRRKKKIRWAAFLLCLCMGMTQNVFAAAPDIYNSNLEGEELHIVVGNLSKVEEVSCQIGTVKCEDVSVKKKIPVETYILMDNSLSIDNKYHDTIRQTITTLIDGISENETMSLLTFDKELHYLIEDSSDKDALKKAAESVTYENLDTKITDVMYILYQDLAKEPFDGLRRIVLISDGAEYSSVGYTRQEVRDSLEALGYPVCTIGCTYKDNTNELEEMFSLSRLTGGSYVWLDEQNDPQTIADSINKCKKVVQVVIQIPEQLGDGTEKGVKLNFQTAKGEKNVSTTEIMPFIEVAEPEITEAPKPEVTEAPEPEVTEAVEPEVTEAVEPEVTKAAEPEVTEAAEPEVTEAAEPETTEAPEQKVTEAADPTEQKEDEAPDQGNKTENRLPFPPGVIGIGGVALIFGILMFLLSRKRAREEEEDRRWTQTEQKPEETGSDRSTRNADDEKTRFPGYFPDSDRTMLMDDDKTEMMGGRNGGGIGATGAVPVLIRLTDISQPDRIVEVPLRGTLRIGRKVGPRNDIAFNYDQSVSAEHCTITEKNGKFFVVDRNSRNGTWVGKENGMANASGEKREYIHVVNETEICNGDILQMGRLKLRFEKCGR